MNPRDAAHEILAEVSRAVVGKPEALRLVLLALLADGHVLIEDLPGLAKTLIARSFAAATGLDFKRIQFTPDLMPADVTGVSVFNPAGPAFEFRPGPVFANLLLADEINRAPAKTQAALLEAMHERQVTVDGVSHRLPRPFLVIATQNPIEFEGTYPLPEAQLDRFLVRVKVGYPSQDDEREVLARRVGRGSDEMPVSVVIDAAGLLAAQRALEDVHVSDAIMRYIVALVTATRGDPRTQVGSSPRGSLAVLKLSRGTAMLEDRDYVIPDDVKAVAMPALAHRILLRPELWIQDVRTEDVVQACLDSVPTPTAEELARER